MSETKKQLLVLAFTLFYMVVAGIYFIVAGRAEFVAYLGVLLVLVGLFVWAVPRIKIPVWCLWLLSILGLLHALGGGVEVNGDVLYNLVVIPIINQGPNGITIWRFDQMVHPYGTAIAAIIFYYFTARRSQLSTLWLIVIASLAAMGAGAVNEVIEFATKLTIPNTDVGGYNNTALDLTVNMIGAVIGASIAALKWGKNPPATS